MSKPPPSNSHQEQAIIAVDPQIAIRQVSKNSHPPSLQGSINELVECPELPQHVSIEEKKEETDFGGNGIQHLSRTEGNCELYIPASYHRVGRLYMDGPDVYIDHPYSYHGYMIVHVTLPFALDCLCLYACMRDSVP